VKELQGCNLAKAALTKVIYKKASAMVENEKPIYTIIGKTFIRRILMG
jgi:hypothetical protein